MNAHFATAYKLLLRLSVPALTHRSAHAPNNGSWTYNVPLNIEAGRHSFSIGYNPVQMSDTTDIFVIDPSQTSSVPPPAITTNPAWQTYRGCGLPPLPDYTYTGYQPPCTITTSGRVETIYPIVPASDSSVFFGSIPQASKTTTATTTPTASANSAFATGVFAQALQCANPVIPSPTSITADGATTVFTLVACNTAVPSGSVSIVDSDGVCHASGYATFSVSGTSSVCCPNGWATTPLNSELFCFTSTAERGPLEDRRGLSETSLEGSHTSIVDIVGLVFTAAGVVTKDVSVSSSPPDASPSGSAGGDSGSTATATRSSAASTATTKSGGVKLNARLKVLPLVAGIAGILPYLFL